MMHRYKPIGWQREPYRHSLAAKGIKTRLVANANKGWRSADDPMDKQVWNGKKFVSERKSLAAQGVETFNKRRDGKKPSFPESEFEPMKIPDDYGMGAESGFTSADIQEQDYSPNINKQAQQVESGLAPIQSAPLFNQGPSDEVEEGPITQFSREENTETDDNLVRIPELATPTDIGVFESKVPDGNWKSLSLEKSMIELQDPGDTREIEAQPNEQI
jgi:hypothetical protein